MILFTSDIERIDRNTKIKKTIIRYSAITAFCVLFSSVYEHFSHGVYSNYMILLFLFPLIGGVLPYGLLKVLPRIKYPDVVSSKLYNSGIATLAVGSCICGVLEIYGTSSNYTVFYWIAGIILLIVSLGMYFYGISSKMNKER